MADTVSINVSTTGIVSSVIIEDLDNLELLHPSTISLSAMFDLSSLSNSLGLQSAIASGKVVVRDEENVIISQVKALESRTSRTWAYCASISDDSVEGNRYFELQNGARTDKTPYVLPQNARLYAVSATGRLVNQPFIVRLYRNGSVVYTYSRANTPRTTLITGLNILFSAGDELWLQFVEFANNTKVEHPGVIAYFEAI